MELRDDGMCFVCGKKNPIGLKLDFKLKDRTLITRFTPEKKHQGYADIVHGGIIAMVLDEMLVNLPWLLGIKAVTAAFSVRYKRPVTVGEELFFESHIIKEQGRLLLVEAEVKTNDDSLVATAQGKCMRVE